MPRSNITLRDWCITNNIDLIQFLLNKADADNLAIVKFIGSVVRSIFLVELL